MAQSRRTTTLLILVGVLVLAIILALTIQNWQAIGLGGGTVLVLLVLLRILPDLVDEPVKRRIKAARRADRGAAAEEVVGDLLAGLGEDFFVLHDIPSPYGNIDHIVIGKNSGVFLLETKAHGGRVELLPDSLLVNGKQPEKDFIAQALKNTCWLRDEIEKLMGRKVWVTPVLVFTNAFVPTGKPVKGVTIINKRFLAGILQRPARSTSDLPRIWEAKDQIADRLNINPA